MQKRTLKKYSRKVLIRTKAEVHRNEKTKVALKPISLNGDRNSSTPRQQRPADVESATASCAVSLGVAAPLLLPQRAWASGSNRRTVPGCSLKEMTPSGIARRLSTIRIQPVSIWLIKSCSAGSRQRW